MFRTLPPAGHGISLSQILRAFPGEQRRSFQQSRFAPFPHCLYVSSGTAALYLSLKTARRRSARTQVLLPAYSCPSLLAAVVAAGLEPALCDVRPNSFQLDTDQLSRLVSEKTLAVIAVHLFGLTENIQTLRSCLGDGEVMLIEDAAQSFGNTITADEIRPGSPGDEAPVAPLESFGDLGVLSFGRGKPLSALEGGAVLVRDADLYQQARAEYELLSSSYPLQSRFGYLVKLALYSLLFPPSRYWVPASMPWLGLGETRFDSNLNVKKARPLALSLVGTLLERFELLQQARIRRVRAYSEVLAPFRELLAFVPFEGKEDAPAALLRYPVIFKKKRNRDIVLERLRSRGLGATGMYPAPLNELPGTAAYFTHSPSCPSAKFVSERILTLPVHDYVTDNDICNIAKSFSL